MKRLRILGPVALSLSMAACTTATPPPVSPGASAADTAANSKATRANAAEMAAMNVKLDEMRIALAKLERRSASTSNESSLRDIERRLDRVERNGSRPLPPRRPPRPDASATYAVPIAGSATSGPRHALVTMVMAFEFA